MKQEEAVHSLHVDPLLFPGHQAGASLKRGGAGRLSVAAAILFPGHQAGASLKRNLVRNKPYLFG